MGRKAFEAGQFIGRLLMGQLDDDVQRGYNQARREHNNVILDTLSVAVEAKQKLEVLGFGTSSSDWGPGGRLDREMVEFNAKQEAELQATRKASKDHYNKNKVHIEAQRTRNAFGPGYFGKMTDQQVYDWTQNKIKEDADNLSLYGNG